MSREDIITANKYTLMEVTKDQENHSVDRTKFILPKFHIGTSYTEDTASYFPLHLVYQTSSGLISGLPFDAEEDRYSMVIARFSYQTIADSKERAIIELIDPLAPSRLEEVQKRLASVGINFDATEILTPTVNFSASTYAHRINSISREDAHDSENWFYGWPSFEELDLPTVRASFGSKEGDRILLSSILAFNGVSTLDSLC